MLIFDRSSVVAQPTSRKPLHRPQGLVHAARTQQGRGVWLQTLRSAGSSAAAVGPRLCSRCRAIARQCCPETEISGQPDFVCIDDQKKYKDCHEASVDPRKGTAACGKNPALVARIEQLSQAFAGRSNRIGRLGVVVAAVSGHIDCSKHRRVAARPKSAILPREHQQAVLTLPTRRARLGTFLSMVLRGAQTTPFASERALQSTI